jgi:predicted secreted Zn-dependent protease
MNYENKIMFLIDIVPTVVTVHISVWHRHSDILFLQHIDNRCQLLERSGRLKMQYLVGKMRGALVKNVSTRWNSSLAMFR